jgi:uncharacterized protein (DUF169 family)
MLNKRLIDALEVPGLKIPTAAVKLFPVATEVPDDIYNNNPGGMTITACHAMRSAMLGDAAYVDAGSIGCIAAAISLGLVDAKNPEPLDGPRVYTELMRQSSGKGTSFVAPAPAEFSNGTVYACKDSGREEYSLFGENDAGRYGKKEIANKAVAGMMAIQPPATRGVYFYGADDNEFDLKPDIIVMAVRPVELCRLIQGHQFLTGERTTANVGGLRAGCSDLIARPYITKTINFSPFCLGARLIAKFEADRMGLGMPFDLFEAIVEGVEASRTGFPFPKYPGAQIS